MMLTLRRRRRQNEEGKKSEYSCLLQLAHSLSQHLPSLFIPHISTPSPSAYLSSHRPLSASVGCVSVCCSTRWSTPSLLGTPTHHSTETVQLSTNKRTSGVVLLFGLIRIFCLFDSHLILFDVIILCVMYHMLMSEIDYQIEIFCYRFIGKYLFVYLKSTLFFL